MPRYEATGDAFARIIFGAVVVGVVIGLIAGRFLG